MAGMPTAVTIAIMVDGWTEETNDPTLPPVVGYSRRDTYTRVCCVLEYQCVYHTLQYGYCNTDILYHSTVIAIPILIKYALEYGIYCNYSSTYTQGVI